MLRSRFSDALKTAMKARDAIGVSTVRLILAALKDRDIAARTRGQGEPISDQDILKMLQAMVAQRRESIVLYERGQRPELVAREQQEITVIETFLPSQMDDAAIRQAVGAAIREIGATGLKDMGPTMALLRERFAGTMDFAKASLIVREHLA